LRGDLFASLFRLCSSSVIVSEKLPVFWYPEYRVEIRMLFCQINGRQRVERDGSEGRPSSRKRPFEVV
jgi:hypothetical protein